MSSGAPKIAEDKSVHTFVLKSFIFKMLVNSHSFCLFSLFFHLGYIEEVSENANIYRDEIKKIKISKISG